MDKLFDQAPYAEDQKYAKVILTTHVLHRGLAAGVPVGLAVAGIRRALGRPSSLLKASAAGAAGGIAILAVGLTGLMHDKQEIEWQDRSWRLLSNEGSNSTDIASISGAAAGALAATYRPPRLPVPNLARIVGGAGIGSFFMTFLFMAIHGEQTSKRQVPVSLT